MTGTRLLWASLLALSSLIGSGTRSCVATAHAEPLPLVRGVGCVGFTVSDVDRSADFFTRVLGFEKRAEIEPAGEAVEQLQGAQTRTLRIRLGRECLDLSEYLAPRGRPAPPDSRSNDRWFQHVAIVVSDMDRAYAILRAAGVEHASTGPQRLPDWNPNAAGIRAFYFRDPDRHVLEVIQFPPGKGAARWHEANALFLGIDHTAIVVADTDASLRFYRDGLGLRVAGTSENWGPEQEHLNNVAGAHLRITTLRAASGPGVELLEYLAPRDGRPFPADARSNDLIHWHTTLLTGDLRADQKAMLARDPDGHALQFAAE
jgi:catechol 2,3-dioxygenase-like lactoylglutathione lyase family enzyme